MMFIVSLIEFSKHVQNEISAKVMPKPQNFTADFADEMKLSKATVSRLAKQMIKAGKIIKKSRSLDVLLFFEANGYKSRVQSLQPVASKARRLQLLHEVV
jgi:hypothetical protein